MQDPKDQEIKSLKSEKSALQNQNEALQKELENQQAVENAKPYKCLNCGDRVNFVFIVAAIKNSGLCPNCWHENE